MHVPKSKLSNKLKNRVSSTVSSSVVSARAAFSKAHSSSMDWKSELMVAISDDDEAAVERILPRLEHIDDKVLSHLHLRHKLTLRMTKLKYTSQDTLLLLATRNGRVRSVEKLLSLGADVSSSDKDGKTAQQVR